MLGSTWEGLTIAVTRMINDVGLAALQVGAPWFHHHGLVKPILAAGLNKRSGVPSAPQRAREQHSQIPPASLSSTKLMSCCVWSA